jgi:uncharacterized protein (UPF0332 family)
MISTNKNIPHKAVEADRISYRLSRAKESFEEAELLATHKSWNGCLDRLFNSCYRMASALLLKHGIVTKTHSGLNTEFGKHFVKTGSIPEEEGILLANITRWKYESDFGGIDSINKEVVNPLIPQVKKFLKDIEVLINTDETKSKNKKR